MCVCVLFQKIGVFRRMCERAEEKTIEDKNRIDRFSIHTYMDGKIDGLLKKNTDCFTERKINTEKKR